VQVLTELDYVVDVAHAEDTKFKPQVNYQLIIRQRAGEFPAIKSPFFAHAKKVYLATGMNPLVHNQNLRRRHEAFELRSGQVLPIERLQSEEMDYAASADAVFAFGNENTGESWRKFTDRPLYMFDNYAYKLQTESHVIKNYDEARKHFLYFASGTQILKGLDLLLEIFPRYPELHLYVCGSYENEHEFCHYYRQELLHTPNVHPCGWIGIGSAEYHQITSLCAFTILPSCTEGAAGSVVQTMLAALAPVVTKECGIDIDDFGATFKNGTLVDIEQSILELSGLSSEEVQRRCELSRIAAEERYSEKAFLARWREMIQLVML
jgi:hypothetical protein